MELPRRAHPHCWTWFDALTFGHLNTFSPQTFHLLAFSQRKNIFPSKDLEFTGTFLVFGAGIPLQDGSREAGAALGLCARVSTKDHVPPLCSVVEYFQTCSRPHCAHISSFPFPTASPGGAGGGWPRCSERGKSLEPLQPLAWRQAGLFVLKMHITEGWKNKYVF